MNRAAHDPRQWHERWDEDLALKELMEAAVRAPTVEHRRAVLDYVITWGWPFTRALGQPAGWRAPGS